jgi:hypothetical protein
MISAAFSSNSELARSQIAEGLLAWAAISGMIALPFQSSFRIRPLFTFRTRSGSTPGRDTNASSYNQY